METGEHLGTFHGHDNYLLSVAITPDGTRAISSGYDDLIIVWNLTAVAGFGVGSGDGEGDGLGSAWSYDSVLHVINSYSDDIRDIVISQDGGRMLTGSANNEVVVWDLQTFDVAHRLNDAFDKVNHVAMSPDGSRIVAVDGYGYAHWYRLRTTEEHYTDFYCKQNSAFGGVCAWKSSTAFNNGELIDIGPNVNNCPAPSTPGGTGISATWSVGPKGVHPCLST